VRAITPPFGTYAAHEGTSQLQRTRLIISNTGRGTSIHSFSTFRISRGSSPISWGAIRKERNRARVLCISQARQSSLKGEGMARDGRRGSHQMGVGELWPRHLRFTGLCWEYVRAWPRRLGQSDRRYVRPSQYRSDKRLCYQSTTSIVVQRCVWKSHVQLQGTPV
jgi:hypothetical protein